MSQMPQTQKKGSFRRNVIATFLLISIISLGVTSFISLNFVDLIGSNTTDASSDALQIQIERNMELTAEQNALAINQKLANAEAMVNAMAEECEAIFRDDITMEPSNTTFQPREVYYDYFFENTSAGPHPSDVHYEEGYGLNVSWTYSSWYVSGSTIANYDSYEALNADKLYKVSNLDHLFEGIHMQMPEFRWLYLAFADNGLFINYPGSILLGDDAERIQYPYDPRGEDWYDAIADGNGDIVFYGPYADEFDGVVLVSIGKVIYYSDGLTPIGVISGDITIEDINTKILDVQVLESGYASLITSDGFVIAHPEVGEEDYLDYAPDLPPLSHVETNDDLPDSPALTPLQVTTITTTGTGILTYDRSGESYVLAYAPVGKGGYICIIIVPVDEVQAAIPALQARIQDANLQAATFIIGITLAGVIIAGAVAIVISNSITKPLEYLMGLAMKNVSAMIKEEPLDTEDLQVDQSYIGQDDEIGELARAFQGMLDSIREDEP
jgi:HAMP domain-containing protein